MQFERVGDLHAYIDQMHQPFMDHAANFWVNECVPRL